MADEIENLDRAWTAIVGVNDVAIIYGAHGDPLPPWTPEVALITLREDENDVERCIAEIRAIASSFSNFNDLLPEGYRVLKPGDGKVFDVTPR